MGQNSHRARQPWVSLDRSTQEAAIYLIGLVCSALFVVGVLWAARRANELFVLSIRGGRVLHLRGRLPPALFTSICEVAAQPPIERARVRVVRERGVAKLLVHGSVSVDQVQRLRNVIGLFPLARIRAGRPAPGRVR